MLWAVLTNTVYWCKFIIKQTLFNMVFMIHGIALQHIARSNTLCKLLQAAATPRSTVYGWSHKASDVNPMGFKA